ncbi:MAG: hypothetical protein V3V10_06225 [Planctomycetota bacterium]
MTTLRLHLLLILAISLVSQSVYAQASLESPYAAERSEAIAGLGKNQSDYWRKILDKGDTAPRLINGLLHLQNQRKTKDIARIAKYVGDIDPFVGETAAAALRSFGRKAIKAIDAIPAGDLDPTVRKELLEELLLDHVRACCYRDMRLNPERFSYKTRFDELFSISHDLEQLMFELIKESRAAIVEDMGGGRNQYWGRQFVEYGGLVIAALGKKYPERLKEELKDVIEMEFQTRSSWWVRPRASATIETAIFFAHQGQTRLVDKLITDMQKSFRNRGNAAGQAIIHVNIAALEYVALGDTNIALDRIDENKDKLLQSDSVTTTRAYYLRARIMMDLGQEGSALNDLEQALECSDSAVAILNVDDAFEKLSSERRFTTIKAYVELHTRRLWEGERPWQPDTATSEDDESGDDE